MLGLAKQIGRADFAIDRLVGDHKNFGRTGNEINAYTSEELPLRFRDEGIAWANNHRHRIDICSPQRHRSHRLNAAHAVNFIRATQVHRRTTAGFGLPWYGGEAAMTRGTPATFA